MAAGTHPDSGFHGRTRAGRGGHATTDAPGRAPWRPGDGAGRVLRGAAWVVGAALLFVLCAVGAALIHLNTPLGRRMAAERINALLDDTFRGKVHIDHVGALGLFGVRDLDATVLDPSGRPVLVVRGARVRVATLTAARSALFGKPRPLLVDVGQLSIRDLDVSLDTDADGQLALLDALAPKHPTAPDPNARGLRLVAHEVVLTHGAAHGNMGSGPPLDVRLDDLAAALTYAPDVLEAELHGAKLAARKIVGGLDLDAALHGRWSQSKRAPDGTPALSGRLDWDGSLGTSRHTLTASIDDDRVRAVLEAPAIAPADLHALLPSAGASAPGALRLTAQGVLSRIAVDLRAALGQGSLRVNGDVGIAHDKSAVLAIEARDVDLHDLDAGAPASRLGLRGDLRATSMADGALHGDLFLRFLGGALGERRLPTASIRATASRGSAGDLRGDADVVVDEPSAPVRLTAEIGPRGGASAASFTLDASAPDLNAVPELDHLLRGRARLDAKGTIDLGRRTMDVHLDAAADGVVRGENRLASARLQASASGPLSDPRADVVARATGISAGRLKFASLNAVVSGRARSPRVTVAGRGVDSPDVEASADLDFDRGVRVGSLRMALARGGEVARITADRVQTGGGTFHVEGGRVEGLGAPLTLELTGSPDALRVRSATAGLDFARVARVAHLEDKLRSGVLGLDVDLDLRADHAYGQAKIDLRQAEALGVKDASAHVELKLDGRKLAGRIQAASADVGSIDVRAPSLAIGGGGPLSAARWKDAWGDVTFDAHADLGRLQAIVPPREFPFTEARGDVVVKGHVTRQDLRDPTPDLALAVITNGLLLTPKTVARRAIDGVYVMPHPPWKLAGMDFDLDAQVDGDRGSIKLTTLVRDAKGPLAQVKASADRLPLRDWIRDPQRSSEEIRQAPFDVHVVVPNRGLGGMPDILKQNYLSGRLKADLSAKGTLLHPTVHLTMGVSHSRLAGTTRSLPLDLSLVADYDGVHGRAKVQGASGGRDVVDLDADLDADASALAAPGRHPLAWRSSARAHFDKFPLDGVIFLDDKVVSGQLSGDLTLADLHKDARADVSLNVDTLSVGNVHYSTAALRAKADGHDLDASLRIDQKDGFLEAKAHGATSWGAALAPMLAPDRPLDFSLAARGFQIGGLLPFVDASLDQLEGRLDADTHGQLQPQPRSATVTGEMTLHDGAFEAAAGGGAFHNVDAKVTFAPGGAIKLEKLTASGMSGRVEASGDARLEGLKLAGAHVVVDLPSDAPLPLSAGGTDLGNVDGRIEITAAPSPGTKTMGLKIEVPHLRVSLPEESSKTAQALGEIPNLHIGAHRGHPLRFVLIALDGAREKKVTPGSPMTGPTGPSVPHVEGGPTSRVAGPSSTASSPTGSPSSGGSSSSATSATSTTSSGSSSPGGAASAPAGGSGSSAQSAPSGSGASPSAASPSNASSSQASVPASSQPSASAASSPSLDIKTHLADVQVIRGTQLKVDLVGSIEAKTGETTQVTGQIHLKRGGVLSVQGKDFSIENGTVSFVGGDPGNPEVVVKAGWKAPDGTMVYANFVGPLKTGKVTLTSEPPLSQEEIVELVLFGSANGKQALSPNASPTNSAIGTVGGEATQPLNHALNQLGLGAVTTKVDTSQASTPRPEVAVQIARDISIQIAVVLGQPPPGVNPDRTLLTFDWRFLSLWSLSSTLGDAGTTIFDVLWQRRY